MDFDPVIDLSSDESISNIPLVNFYSPPPTATKTNRRYKEPPPSPPPSPPSKAPPSKAPPSKAPPVEQQYSGRKLRSSTKPFSRVLLKKKYSEKSKKSKEKEKEKESPSEEQPQISVDKVKEPEVVVEKVVTNSIKPKGNQSKAIPVLEEVTITPPSVKVNKPQVKLFVDIDPELEAKGYLSGLRSDAVRAGMRVRPAAALHATALVLWAKAGDSTLNSVHGTVELTPPEMRCSRGLFVCEMEEVAKRVSERTLVSHMKSLESIACCKLSLVMFGFKEFFKSACKRHRLVSEFDIETAIADLIVSNNCDTIVINSAYDLVMTLVQYHKGFISFYKKEICIEEEEAEFYMKGFSKKCVGVDKDGTGLARLWQQMMAILPKSSLETSRALCAEMSSPRELYETLSAPMGEERVAEVAVSRAGGPGTRTRRLGPELAKKLKILFTEEDGSTIVM